MKINIVKLSLVTLGLCAFTLAASAQEKKKPNPEQVFKRSDLNKDGSITLEEFKNTKRKKEVAEEALEKRFKRMDADENGLVTLEEFKAHLDKAKAKAKKKKEQ